MSKSIKNKLSIRQKKAIKRWLNKPFVIGRKKVFCISMQRTGTTSVGTFLNDHGIRTAGHSESVYYNWGYNWKIGNYDAIFKSTGFKAFQGYQDGPWWAPDFYKILYHRFPESKFILLTRDSEDWFDSMIRHSDGKTLGNTYLHCKIYQRMDDYFQLIGDNNIDFGVESHVIDNLLSLEEYRSHYCNYYDNYNREVVEFFNYFDKNRLFISELKNKDKWIKLGNFLGLSVDKDYVAHSNKSQDK